MTPEVEGFDMDTVEGGGKGCEAEVGEITKASVGIGANTDNWVVLGVLGLDLFTGAIALGVVDLLALAVVMGALRIFTTPP